MVFASRPGVVPKRLRTSSQTSAKGFFRVFQVCGFFIWLGSLPAFKYFRAIFSSIPLLAAAAPSVSLLFSICSLLT
jgi:hypothetical protein